jgi:alkanesulfonate monooxygenase SsuD/methylene tetrahydromethanopterin reductase-like flavin-dependent oxidoreductase (luciferase family)
MGLAAMSGGFPNGRPGESAGVTVGEGPKEGPQGRALGFMLPHEQFNVAQLVEFGVAAENAGFDFVATSDHFQPWQDNEGHSGMAWVTMAALGQRTSRIQIGTTVH